MMVFAQSYFYLFLQFLLLFVSVVTSETNLENPKDENVKPMKTYYFNQKLDHDFTDTEYFTQRYYVYKNDNYKAGNPVFLVVGGSVELTKAGAGREIWTSIVDDSRGLLLALEHRMYGFSYIENGWENTIDNLLYLNTKQALADLAYFRDELVGDNPTGIYISTRAKWVAMGSDYGATLAVFLRSKYPNKIEAAVAIDAPLLATVEYNGFYINVENWYNRMQVGNTIKEAFVELKEDLNSCETNESDTEKLKCLENKIQSQYKDIFKLCSSHLSRDYDVKDHKTLLFLSLTTILSRAYQLPNDVIDDVIKILLDKKTIPKALNRLGAAINSMLNVIIVDCLINDYGKLINSYKDTSILAEKNLNLIPKLGLGYRQSLYQRCSERGQFETANENDGIFANLIPVDFYMNICKRVFVNNFSAQDLEDATKNYNKMYGGRTMNVSQVMFIWRKNGFWRNLGFAGDFQKNVGILLNGDRSMSIREWHTVSVKLKHYLRI